MYNLLLRIERRVFAFLIDLTSSLRNFAIKRFFAVNKKLTSAEYKDLLNKILASQEEFLARAKKYSEIPELSAAEKELVYYYFLIKHFIAEHETRAVEIPLQVFSEHRMALDHFIRAKISNKEGNVDKAIGHLRRALLDSIKINSSKLKKEIEKRHEAIPKKSLGLISNGEYIKNFIKWQQQAEGMLNDARCEEYRLGNKVEENIEVVNLFIKAFLAHREWHKFQAENMGNTLYISATYYAIKGWPLLVTSILSFFVGYAVNFVYDNSFAKLIEKIMNFGF